MTGFFSRKAKNREELLRNEARRYGDEERIKVIGKRLLTSKTYEYFSQNLNENYNFIE